MEIPSQDPMRGPESKVPRSIYYGDSYFLWPQLASLVRQLIEVKRTRAATVLEIGPGNGFVSSFLKASGVEVTTFDVNEELRPDVLGSVLELDRHFEASSFDCVLCAEVLEHLPFAVFEEAVAKLAIVSKRDCVLTLPVQQRILLDMQCRLKLPCIDYKQFGMFLALNAYDKSIYSGHCWEINHTKETDLRIVRAKLERCFSILKDYREVWKPYHRFFILTKEQ